MSVGFAADGYSALKICIEVPWCLGIDYWCLYVLKWLYLVTLHLWYLDSFKKLKVAGFLSMQTGQTWWVHAKVISPSVHVCQGISLGNSPKCGNSLGTDWCRRVKKAESDCVLIWVCMCVGALRADSNANKRKLPLSNSALVFSDGISPLWCSDAS